MKAVLHYSWRVGLAACVLTGTTFLSYDLLGKFHDFPAPTVGNWHLLGVILVSSLLISAVLAYLIMRSRWSGTQLVCAVFVAFFGLYTFIPQVEAVLMVRHRVSTATSALLTAHGFLLALVFSVFLVALMGRLFQPAPAQESSRLHLPAVEWLWKIGVCVGAGVAADLATRLLLWRGSRAELLPDLPSGLMLLTGRDFLLLVFLLPVIKMMRGARLEAALTVAFVSCTLAGIAPLVAANPFLPDVFPLHHALGIGGANFAFGLLAGYLFSRSRGAAP